jgi:hypothetical protein
MRLLGAGGGTSEVLAGSLREISFGDLKMENMNAIIASIEGLGLAYGRRLDGIVGYNLMTKGIISLDFADKVLRIYPFDAQNAESH